MYITTSDAELIAKLILSGWKRGEDDETFYWPTKRMPRA